MKLFSTLIQRITAIAVVLAMAFGANAAERTFATLADMHAATDLVEGDEIKITGDVVFEYSYTTNFVVSDKNGTATCMNDYCYYIGQVIAEQSLKAGDILKNYSGTLTISPIGVYRLEPALDKSKTNFAGGITIEHTNAAYEVKTTKVTIKDLLENPANYDGKVVSLDLATTKTVGFNTYLIQGTDTLKNFVIYGLNDDEYPLELIIKRALFKVNYNGAGSLSMMQQDFDVTFMSVKSFKATGLTENIEVDLTVQVLKKEVYEGKTYLTVFESTGNKLIDCAGLRILLNTENEVDKKIKVGDVINIKTSTAQYKKWVDTGVYFTHSLVTLDAHETSILENKPIKYYVIYSDNIGVLGLFEFLPVTIAAELTFTGGENKTHKEKNFAQAQLFVGEEETVKIYVDVTKKPADIKDKFHVNGILEIPLWQAKSMNTYVIPLSEKDFFGNSKEFDNIAELLEFGTPMLDVVNYALKNAVTITGIKTIVPISENDQIQNIIFVADATGSLMLRGVISAEVGDAITAVSGYYNSGRPTIVNDDYKDFGVAANLELDSTGVEVVTAVTETIEPIEVTIAQLLASDKYASKLVKLTNFTYKEVDEIVQDETITRHFIYQGTDSMAVDASFKDQKNKSLIIGNYYLNGYYTSIIPTIEITTIGDKYITVLSNNTTWGKVTGAGFYNENDEATLTATANSGYRFVKWSDEVSDNPRTVVVTQDSTFTAIFEANTFAITTAVNDDAIGSVTEGGKYAYGTEITLTATANSGYRFVKWSDGNTENPRIVTVTENKTYTAEFELNTYTLIAHSYSPNMGGVKITLTAEPIKGFEFVGWSDGSTENPYEFYITENTELYAYFQIAQGGTPVDLETSKISSANIYTTNGTLHIEGATESYHILDAAGRLIYSGNATTLTLPRGIYLVTINGEVEKVVL